MRGGHSFAKWLFWSILESVCLIVAIRYACLGNWPAATCMLVATILFSKYSNNNDLK